MKLRIFPHIRKPAKTCKINTLNYLQRFNQFIYFVVQSTFFMGNPARELETLQDIKRMMERSSRFISLSGWSGIAAGICALLGAGFAYQRIHHYYASEYLSRLITPADLRMI